MAVAVSPSTMEVRGCSQLPAEEAAAVQLVADSKFLQRESLVELVKAVVQAAGPLQRLSATPESMENAEVTRHASAGVDQPWKVICTHNCMLGMIDATLHHGQSAIMPAVQLCLRRIFVRMHMCLNVAAQLTCSKDASARHARAAAHILYGSITCRCAVQMCVELVIAVALRNRDRLLLIWPYTHDFLAAILAPAQVCRMGCRAHERPTTGCHSREICHYSASVCIC